MLNVGLTGGIGAGKSEVTKRFAALGAKVIDADAIAREVVEPGTPGLAAVIEEFGEGVRAADGSLDREAVAAIVFGDDDARARLNAIVHPLIGERVFAKLAEYEAEDPDGILINDVPLIAEAGVAERYEVIVVVDAPVEVQLDRLVRLRGMTPEAARARIDVQASREERLALATHVIVNDGDLDALQRQVEQVWQDLLARSSK
ncbi:MAG TPA: dephospho-CoA kinase [Mycobacteriales bacterium]|nr:dephospho-CoA kinase [Mycobacteriales bacterium]